MWWSTSAAGSTPTPSEKDRPRYGMSRAVVEHCDRLVAVGLGTPVGVARLLEWLATAESDRRCTSCGRAGQSGPR